MEYAVTVQEVPARATAVVPAVTTWRQFPELWGTLLGEVWDCLRQAGVTSGCRNVILYRDGRPSVEVGVLFDRPEVLTGRVVASALPSGLAAVTVHRGSFAELGSAHEAVLAWCADTGHRPTGVRWEVYGPHDDDPARQWTEISWLLTGAQDGQEATDERPAARK